MPKQTKCLLLLLVSVSCLVLMFIIVYYGAYFEKKAKIIAEIDLVIKNYASTDFDKLLHSKKKQKRNMSGTNIA